MLSWTISLLISMGLMLSADQWHNMTTQEKEDLESIIITIDAIGSLQFEESAIAPGSLRFSNQTSEMV